MSMQVITETNHAWNSIRIDGVWYPCDATWGAGSCSDHVFHKKFKKFWWLTPPEQFVYTHLPAKKQEDSLLVLERWLCLPPKSVKTWTLQHFAATLPLSHEYFESPLRIVSDHNSPEIQLSSGQMATIMLKETGSGDDRQYLLARFKNSAGKEVDLEMPSYKLGTRTHQIVVAAPRACGAYELSLYRSATQYGSSYRSFVKYKVVVVR